MRVIANSLIDDGEKVHYPGSIIESDDLEKLKRWISLGFVVLAESEENAEEEEAERLKAEKKEKAAEAKRLKAEEAAKKKAEDEAARAGNGE